MSQKKASSSRLDQILIERGLFTSREVARTAIMDGGILVNGEKVTKPGAAIKDSAIIEVLEKFQKPPYVSRGGLKLAKALNWFQVDVSGLIAIDVGASTGGFTDCLLKHGASFVYAVDVGYGQIDWSLRTDERVKVVERCNIRYLKPESLNLKATGEPTLAVMDVSFISVTKTIPNTLSLMQAGEGQLIILIKPQFEAGRGKVAKGGVVRDKQTHIELLQSCLSQLRALNLNVAGLTYSPIKGPSGNIEYLLHLLKGAESTSADIDIPALVEEAFLALN
ncbi:MAG: TlyA family RNA methyltransferase [Candidatus Obscuribacter sp.]|jgi:23S rRNA (cytidine1920-2'-O)/16S rRNA (cytidine1409-2'-O)-methyltransferase|nr:TlyA family RNA methyltransferase [Candidatus Melainabacteria bacterium]MDX1985219.1 TlyA family RNA methyltransferase [Candidatus Obscuribacter sp.]